MLRWNERQRDVLLEKLPDAANLALGGLVFGQFVSGQPFSPLVGVAGIVVWLGFLALAMFLGREREASMRNAGEHP